MTHQQLSSLALSSIENDIAESINIDTFTNIFTNKSRINRIKSSFRKRQVTSIAA